ncbi:MULTISPECIES: amidohydrolase [unclassified Streptomyces]|uniref:amidohydrolase n=1 Tax=unclassified Streptomyces TaxID=2593676 RepID=UPI001370BA06|nr:MULTISPECIES: amidohydrolase [unclassified Streptomyces]NEA04071.1 amidohydrolase [Streptomyces sp. SID10116]MYY81228.1 amidohydrolase [Streptomyces sp. SID335]MYZ19354.1 amidohydrolase [Streptomyces sp. SID337]NDZ88537.1 amidohydrolase [Streptomyces sp. SID10115]NEB50481.1 amidohydrolase [Streptomyces sp. SID339]
MSAAERKPSALLGLDAIRDDLAALYRDLHAHPELSFAEHRTAAEVARRAESYGYEVTTGVGRTGVVAVLENGTGPTVLLRADFDGLPVTERTGLPYASVHDGVMHACGHDMHVTCLLGALKLLADARADWSGRIVGVFQPAEEVAKGAQAMVRDGFYARFGVPDVVLGQHVGPLPAGMIGAHPGPAFAATDSLRVRMFGKGAHGSRPESSIDPVVMAAATVMRLQTVVSREISGAETAVVTVGSLQAGTKDNIIPDEAELKINIRSYTPEVRAKVLAAVERIVKGEAVTAGAEREPEITEIDTFPVLDNDADAVARTMAAVGAVIGEDRVFDPGPVTGSEDVGYFATSAGREVPLCYWLFGGADPAEVAAAQKAGTFERDIPSNHSPFFAPLIEPTLTTGVTALTVGALAWLGGRPPQ